MKKLFSLLVLGSLFVLPFLFLKKRKTTSGEVNSKHSVERKVAKGKKSNSKTKNPENLLERQKKLLRYFEDHERVSMQEIAGLNPEVSPRTLRRDLAALVSKKLIKKTGTTKNVLYLKR